MNILFNMIYHEVNELFEINQQQYFKDKKKSRRTSLWVGSIQINLYTKLQFRLLLPFVTNFSNEEGY